ncbi:MAG: MYG1 family protein [Nibricoccus sp.]
MTPITTLLTHPGGAHKDEFLACSVLLALHPVPVVRREPTPADIADVATCVIDVGHVHDPARNNFDHHQLPKDHPPTCSLSLVLQHLGLYEDARNFCEWLEPAEWFDCRGPNDTARWLGVPRDVIGKLNSPIDTTLLRRFAQSTRLEPGQPLWEMMRMIGDDLLNYVKSLRTRLNDLQQTAVFWDLTFADGPAKILFLPRTDPLPDEPSYGVERFIESTGLGASVVGMVCPDRRSTGYGLSRYQDNPRLDFTRIANSPDVHFAHARGFIAKTSATDIAQLKQLLIRAGTPVSPAIST